MTKSKPQTEDQKIKIKATKPSKVKAALKAWVKALEESESDLLELNAAPAWVENALAEVAKIVMPGGRLPTSGEWDLELIGELFGRQQAFGKLFKGETPMGSETEAECDQLIKHAASQAQSPERTARQKAFAKDLEIMIKATNQAIPPMLEAALSSSHEDTLKFQKGLLRGMNLEENELTIGKLFQRHTRTFWVLGIKWRRFAKCRSVAEVHRKLCEEIGEEKTGSLKTFENRVAKKIGMKFGRSGRPPKRK